MKAPAPVPWDRIRIEFIEAWPQTSLLAIAEQHDVPSTTLRARAKREGWLLQARISFARRRVRHCEELERQAAKAARRTVSRVLQLLDGKPSRKALCLAADFAHSDAGLLSSYVAWAAEARADLHHLEATGKDRPRHPAGLIAGLGWRGAAEIRNARQARRAA